MVADEHFLISHLLFPLNFVEIHSENVDEHRRTTRLQLLKQIAAHWAVLLKGLKTNQSEYDDVCSVFLDVTPHT